MATYILAARRTPIGRLNGGLKGVGAVSLAQAALRACMEDVPELSQRDLRSAYIGCVLQAGVGQAPARQVVCGSDGSALASQVDSVPPADGPHEVEAVTVNKVCASGLVSVALAAQELQSNAGDAEEGRVIVAGGMESMSQAPFYVPRGLTFGNASLRDAIAYDGLCDAGEQIMMGKCAEFTAKRFGITRAASDEFAMESYRRALRAQEQGLFAKEIVPVEAGRNVISRDEEPASFRPDKIPTLKPAFGGWEGDVGTITPANASKINDGAAMLLLASEASGLGAKPLARVVSYANHATHPRLFAEAPIPAIQKALRRAQLTVNDISKWEINEAFACVTLAAIQGLKLDADKVNSRGGAVALGHPIGASGARVLTTLLHSLEPGEFGCAAICNGGGGATSLVVERL